MVDPQSQFDPGFAAFGGGATASVLHPAVAVAVLVLVGLTFFLHRRYVIIPVLLGILVIPAGQNLYFGGVHLYIYRVLILVGWARLLSSKASSGKFLPNRLSVLDKVFLAWAIYRALAVVLLFGQIGAITNQVAFLLDSLGGYFCFRSLIRDERDVRTVVKVLAAVACLSALVMLIELKTGQNVLGFLGGIRLISDVRNGRVRAQGVFEHSILAGSFGAVVFPLFLWLWKGERAKFAAVLGVVSSTIIVFASASSTPVVGWFGSLLAVGLWPIRRTMRSVRWAMALALIGLQLVMKAPVWYVIAHIDFAGGSSGWNRANLIDTYIRHVGDWWLIGTHDNMNWGWDMWDQCNQFVTEGETGGLVCLVCFIAMIVICFKKVGIARRVAEGHHKHKQEWLFWLIGATMFAQVMCFMGVDYFDQSKFAWYALLAIVPAATMIGQDGNVAKATLKRPHPSLSFLHSEVDADCVRYET